MNHKISIPGNEMTLVLIGVNFGLLLEGFLYPRNQGQTIKQVHMVYVCECVAPLKINVEHNSLEVWFRLLYFPFFSWVMAVGEPAINLPVFFSQVRIHVIKCSSGLQAKNLHPNNFQVSNAPQIVQVPLGNMFGTDLRCPIQLPMVAHFPN